MGEVSRRRLFGLLASAAVIPAIPPLPRALTLREYGWTDYRGSFGTADRQIDAIVDRRLKQTREQVLETIFNQPTPGAGALAKLTEPENG